jgi:hypothetical protein
MRRYANPWILGIVLLLLVGEVYPAETAKNPGGTAFIKSFLVPGWGQYSLGRTNEALTFFGAELMLVGGMFALNDYGKSTRNDYEAMAAAYAGVTGSHSHDFYVDIGNWRTVDEFNERRLQGRQFDALYTDPNDRWAWDSDEHRAEMEKIRIRSDRAFNNILYFAGGMVLNHIVSAIHAGRYAARHREQPSSPLSLKGWSMAVQPHPQAHGFQLNLSHSF